MSISTFMLAAAVGVSGVYPGLHTFNREGECGTGAVVPWAGSLWVISYAPHMPNCSTDKLYEIKPDLTRVIRAESIGGTPANRLCVFSLRASVRVSCATVLVCTEAAS